MLLRITLCRCLERCTTSLLQIRGTASWWRMCASWSLWWAWHRSTAPCPQSSTRCISVMPWTRMWAPSRSARCTTFTCFSHRRLLERRQCSPFGGQSLEWGVIPFSTCDTIWELLSLTCTRLCHAVLYYKEPVETLNPEQGHGFWFCKRLGVVYWKLVVATLHLLVRIRNMTDMGQKWKRIHGTTL